ncbi:MAG: dTDP-4-dehydrorhamnose reductase [Plectolyngbya sp. WJT66-NPBG17]|jgi:dTDP-4-dehydrorhamnose reductase|nr:dTDP-4-dehydrorhamnose reductase [Plectolyngbya sp. WJT66-NPBG17]MBW4524536.1 dTDP-4-dehydrorhamnose reductase [Phormidium tanganyikae FI6-MK23]
MARILLVGSNGQVGQELERLLPTDQTLAISRSQIDLVQPELLRDAIRQYQPSVIINAAAYTAVDRAESEPESAQTINAIAPTIMAEEAQRLKAGLIHLSTDYVFDGKQNTPYLESDRTNPVSRYGRSKLAGEVGVQSCDRHLILRTAWVYGAYGKSNFVRTMLKLGSDREQLRVVVDQIGSPTWAKHIAEAIVELLPQFEQEQIAAGTYHFTNSGIASWYDFAIAVFEEARSLGWRLNIQEVVPITTAEYPTPAMRPAYSVLACQKIFGILGRHPAHWRQGLRQMLTHLSQTPV